MSEKSIKDEIEIKQIRANQIRIRIDELYGELNALDSEIIVLRDNLDLIREEQK